MHLHIKINKITDLFKNLWRNGAVLSTTRLCWTVEASPSITRPEMETHPFPAKELSKTFQVKTKAWVALGKVWCEIGHFGVKMCLRDTLPNATLTFSGSQKL